MLNVCIVFKMDGDILQNIPDNQLPNFLKIHKTLGPPSSYSYIVLSFILELKKRQPNIVQIMTPQANWSNGSCIAVITYDACTEILMFSKAHNCADLCQALTQTKRINWTIKLVFYAIHSDFYMPLSSILTQIPFVLEYANECKIWRLQKENALKLEISHPPEMYIRELIPMHAEILHAIWPNKFKNSNYYFSSLIKAYGGYGMFEKSSGLLVAVIIRCSLGLGALCVLENHWRKMYGEILVKYLSKKIAEEGIDPIGAVAKTTIAAQKMLSKIGFESEDTIYYIPNKMEAGIVSST